MFQKQAFADVVQNRCSYKFRNIHGCFPVNIEKILRLAFLIEYLPRLCLMFCSWLHVCDACSLQPRLQCMFSL